MLMLKSPAQRSRERYWRRKLSLDERVWVNRSAVGDLLIAEHWLSPSEVSSDEKFADAASRMFDALITAALRKYTSRREANTLQRSTGIEDNKDAMQIGSAAS
jgi:hypothetical protein